MKARLNNLQDFEYNLLEAEFNIPIVFLYKLFLSKPNYLFLTISASGTLQPSIGDITSF